MEQVIISALDCARIDIADKCIKILNKKFPKSLRVLKYQAMKLEAMEWYMINKCLKTESNISFHHQF